MKFRRPTTNTIQAFLSSQKALDLTYDGVGQTNGTPPDGYTVDHTRVRLGTGDAVYSAACSALQGWKQIQLSWLRAWPDNTPIREGNVVAVLARSCGFWWFNACRIVYTFDDSTSRRRFGFAYGTLPGHAGSGEERFMVEMTDEGEVWYDILAFSRASSVAARAAYFLFRASQRRFASDSGNLMRQIAESVQ